MAKVTKDTKLADILKIPGAAEILEKLADREEAIQRAILEERERVRRKRDRTPFEDWWLRCKDEGRPYTAMPAGWTGTGRFT